MNFYYLIAFVCYFSFFLALSIYFYRKNKNSSSFIIGDRSLNYWVTAISAQASDMSDWLFMAYPGLVYASGMFNIWVSFGLILFMFLNWQFIADKLRIATEKYGSLTLASYFESRFSDSSGTLRIATVMFTLIFLCFYIAAELIGLGCLFESTFGINYNLGIAISIALVVLNTLIGGFTAVAWGDMFRGIFLLIMICLVPIVAFLKIGGFTAIVESANLHNISLSVMPDYSLSTFGKIASVVMGWGLGYFGSPHILMNFMGIKDVNKIQKAKVVGISWQILVLSAATFVGLVGIPFFATKLDNKELVFVKMVTELFHPIWAGFILCAILAATMSVMNAQILASASNLSEDLFKRTWKIFSTEKASLWVLRLSVVIIPLISYAISFNNKSSINDLISFAWSGLGLAFAPVVVTALYAKQVNKYGAITGMLLGGTIGIIWPYLNIDIMPLLPGSIISTAAIFIVSALTKKRVTRKIIVQA